MIIFQKPVNYVRESVESLISRCKHMSKRQQDLEYWRRAELDMLHLDPTGIPGITLEAQRAWEADIYAIRAEIDAAGG